MDDELKELKSVLRSLVVSSPTQVDVPTLLRDYCSMVGKPIPLTKYGYKDPVQFLKERFSDCFLFQGPAFNPVLTLIVPDTLKHIDKFVQKQKIPSTLKHKEKRRSIPVEKTSPPKNLISETFTRRQKEKNTETNNKERPIENKPKEENLKKTNIVHNSQPQQNGMCSHTALKNFMRKRIPVYKSTEDLDTEINCNVKDSSKDNSDSGRQTSSSNSSAEWMQLEDLKTEIRNLIEDHPQGVWCADLARLYRERYGRKLNYTRFGYTSVLNLTCVLEDGLSIWRPKGSTDWKLLTSTTSSKPTSALAVQPPPKPLPAKPLPAKPLSATPLVVSRRKTRETVDPEDALPGIDFDADVFPADCMHYTESIPRADLPQESTIEVQVGELYSPSHLWLMRLGNDYNIAMEELMDEMNEYYCRGEGRERVLSLGAVRVGHYCSSCYEGDWHRSLIVKLLDSDTVKVRHVDYGTVEQCAVGSLRPLLRRWGALPQQAIRARLAGVCPPGAGRRWPRASAAHLLHRLTDRRLVAQVVSRSADSALEVVLVDTSTEEDVCINTELIRSGHADAYDSCLATSECYLYPSFEALECGETPNYAEIHTYLRDGIALDFVEDYRRHVPPCLPSPPASSTPPPSPPPSPLPSPPEAPAFFETRVPLFPPAPPLRYPVRPSTVPLPPRPLTSLDPSPHSPSQLVTSLDPSSPWAVTSLDPSPHIPPRSVTSLDPSPPIPPRPVTSLDPSLPRPVTSLEPSFSPPVTSHDSSLLRPVTSLDTSLPHSVTPHDPSPAHTPRDVTLSAIDCEVFYLLCRVDPNTAQRFMMKTIKQATDPSAPAAPAPLAPSDFPAPSCFPAPPTSSAPSAFPIPPASSAFPASSVPSAFPAPIPPATVGLNPEAMEFRMVPAQTHMERSPRMASPSVPLSGYSTTPIVPAVRRFISAAHNLRQQHPPISGIRPPPGFENI